MIRTYTELSQLTSFKERYEYLKLRGNVGEDTFGFDRYLNQMFYRSPEWKHIRNAVIVRDNGCDLGVDGFDIHGSILIHHINPISKGDILSRNETLFNPEYLITTTLQTHNAIHYGDENQLPFLPEDRSPNDTCPWRQHL